LEIAITDILRNRITENVIGGPLDRDVLRRSANDDSQLGFKIGFVLGESDPNRAIVSEQRTRRLEPDERRADLGSLHFLDVIAVVQTDGDYLARRHRNVDREFV
jgi:hypothetical protein